MIAKHAILPWAACAAAALGALAAPPAMAQSAAQRVAIDPETGRLRAPELEELNSPTAAARAAIAAANRSARAAAPAQERARPIVSGVQLGARGYRMDPNRMMHTVVRRNADGTVSTNCVTGESATDKALHAATTGGAHDH
jgi:hypothetical protein